MLSEHIKSAIKKRLDGGATLTEIAGEAGINLPTLTRFYNGDTEPLKIGDRLCEVLGLELGSKEKTKKKTRRAAQRKTSKKRQAVTA